MTLHGSKNSFIITDELAGFEQSVMDRWLKLFGEQQKVNLLLGLDPRDNLIEMYKQKYISERKSGGPTANAYGPSEPKPNVGHFNARQAERMEKSRGGSSKSLFLGLVWAEEPHSVEVDQVRGGVCDPYLSLPGNLAKVAPHDAAIGECRHIDQAGCRRGEELR